MEYLLDKYIEELKVRKLSENTLDAYVRDIKRFYLFLKDRDEEINTIDMVSVMAYVQDLKRLGKANSSIARNIISLRNFYKYLSRKGLIFENPVEYYEIPKIDRNLPDILDYEDIEKLLSIPDQDFKGIRDKAMLEVMYAAGLKVTELLNLRIFDVNLKYKYIKCIGTKNKERIIPVGNFACRYIEEYLIIRDNINFNSLDLLFLNMHGNKMSRQGFWKIIRHYAKEAGIKKDINTFTLRHSCAVHMIQNGADIKLIQELLGHNAINATQIYLSMSKKSKLSEVYKNTHPRA